MVIHVAALVAERDLCFFFQAEDGIRDLTVTGVQTCALPICDARRAHERKRLERFADRRNYRPVNVADKGCGVTMFKAAKGAFIVILLTCLEEIGRASCRERV